MNKEEYLKERGYDVRTILNYFPNNPDKLEKIIEMSPHLAEYIYDEVTTEDENRLIDRIYEILKRVWNAIVDRMRSFDLHPMAESIWAVIKKILLKQKDMSEEVLPDKMCMIPRDIVDEFIEEVERLLEMPQYREMTFRIVAKDMHRVLNGSKGRAHWKEDLAGLMDINK